MYIKDSFGAATGCEQRKKTKNSTDWAELMEEKNKNINENGSVSNIIAVCSPSIDFR